MTQDEAMLANTLNQSPEPVAWRVVDPDDGWRSSWREMREPQELKRDEAEAGFYIEHAFLAPPIAEQIRAERDTLRELVRDALKQDCLNFQWTMRALKQVKEI